MAFNARTIIAYSLTTIVVVSLCIYIYKQSETYLKGPQLEISSPDSGTSTSVALATIVGNAKNVSFLSMNGTQIFMDESGQFTEKLLLSRGYNIIEVKATDRFGRNISRKLHLTKTGSDPEFISDFKTGTTSPAETVETTSKEINN